MLSVKHINKIEVKELIQFFRIWWFTDNCSGAMAVGLSPITSAVARGISCYNIIKMTYPKDTDRFKVNIGNYLDILNYLVIIVRRYMIIYGNIW